MTSKTSCDSSELYYAEMEAARNEAEDAYFEARPHLDPREYFHDVFRAGFERAFQLLWNKRPAVETLDNGGVVEIRGLSRNEVKALTPALFELVTLKIE